MKKLVCPNCGNELDEWGYHLCRNASFVEPVKCEYCGKSIMLSHNLWAASI